MSSRSSLGHPTHKHFGTPCENTSSLTFLLLLLEKEEPPLLLIMENKKKQSTLKKCNGFGISRLWAAGKRRHDQLHLLATNTKTAFLEKAKAKLRNVSKEGKEKKKKVLNSLMEIHLGSNILNVCVGSWMCGGIYMLGQGG